MSGLVIALLGSGEFEPWTCEIDRELLAAARNGDGRVLLLPTASAPEGDEVFDRWAAAGRAHYASGSIRTEVVPLKTREDAAVPGVVASLEDASMVFFSGGNPAYLASTLIDTPFWAAMVDRLSAGLAYAGCSAGAACLPELVPDSTVSTFGPELWKPGLGLLHDVLLGPHWDVLESFAPGITDHIVSMAPPGSVVLGIDETTAIVGDGSNWRVVGEGRAHVHANGGWTSHRATERFELELASGVRTR
ncbi:MAG: Type 1 glutamine amidotransferase-like domain-containing protein [Actinomycetota bacterium]